MSSKQLVIAALALAGALGAGVAQAHGSDDVQWSVMIGAPAYGYGYGQPVYSAPVPVYGAPDYRYEGYRHGYYHHPTRWDRDGDGIPNRYDRVYNPRWDRDGDGIPNRYDHYDNLRHRHEDWHRW